MKKTLLSLSALGLVASLTATPALSATRTTKKSATTKKGATTTKAPATTVAPATTATTAAPATTAAAPTTTRAAGSASLPADADPNGVLRFASRLLATDSTTQFDPAKTATPGTAIHTLVYDTLLRWQPDGTFKPGLARSATVTGEKTIVIELQPNVKFSDGTPLDGAAVKFGLERNAAATNTGANANEIRQLESVTVDSPTKVTVRLKTPIAGAFYNLLSRNETMLVSPTAVGKGQDLQKQPVGAGPFTVESIVPEQKVRLVKNPNYFQADRVRLAAVEYLHVADPTASSNALLAGQIDALDMVQVQTERAVKGKSNFTTLVKTSESTHMWAQICKSPGTGPMSDVRVRQAMNYAIDRDAINKVVYDGMGEPIEALVPTDNVLYNPRFKNRYNLGSRSANIAKAKQLLTEAGFPNGVAIDFFYSVGDSETATQIAQQQLREAGITLNLGLLATTFDFFTLDNSPPRRLGQFFGLQRTGLDKVTRNLQPGSIGNICGYNDNELNLTIELLRARTLDDPDYKKYWDLMTDVVVDKALFIFGSFGVSRNIYSDKVGNPTFILNFQGIPHLDASSAYKKK